MASRERELKIAYMGTGEVSGVCKTVGLSEEGRGGCSHGSMGFLPVFWRDHWVKNKKIKRCLF